MSAILSPIDQLRAEVFRLYAARDWVGALDYPVLRARSLPRFVAIVGADEAQTSLGEQAERFIAEGLPVELQRVPGLGHAYPADFGERLVAILDTK